jgi:hypothetical protein
MVQEIKAPETLSEMLFPLNGTDVAHPFDGQPAGTTAAGLNVRAFEMLTQRARGGSRPGLVRYINSTVSGFNKIQHLTYIVDPQAEALAGGTPSGSPAASNRNLFGGSGGFAPVRFPIEPGRTYPPPPGQLMTGQFDVSQNNGGASPPSIAGSVVATVNGNAFYSGSLTASPGTDASISVGPFNIGTLLPAGTNVLLTVFTWTNAVFHGTFPCAISFAVELYPSGLGGTSNQALPTTLNGTQTVTGNF